MNPVLPVASDHVYFGIITDVETLKSSFDYSVIANNGMLQYNVLKARKIADDGIF